MVFVGCDATPRHRLSPLDPMLAKRASFFQTNGALAWRAANTGFFVNCPNPRVACVCFLSLNTMEMF